MTDVLATAGLTDGQLGIIAAAIVAAGGTVGAIVKWAIRLAAKSVTDTLAKNTQTLEQTHQVIDRNTDACREMAVSAARQAEVSRALHADLRRWFDERKTARTA